MIKNKEDIIGIIPARYSSTRLKGKPLVDILGKPMIQHVYERAKRAELLKKVIIATDDERIADKATEFGAEVFLSKTEYTSGTDRVADAVNQLLHLPEIVVNIQCDEPLIEPTMINEVILPLLDSPLFSVCTLKKLITNKEELYNPNVVKVVTNIGGFALYFSRAPIPYPANNNQAYYKHIGIYAYRQPFLAKLVSLSPSPLERIEKLEQLRILEYGYKMKVIETSIDTISVDTEEDLQRVIKRLKEQA